MTDHTRRPTSHDDRALANAKRHAALAREARASHAPATKRSPVLGMVNARPAKYN